MLIKAKRCSHNHEVANNEKESQEGLSRPIVSRPSEKEKWVSNQRTLRSSVKRHLQLPSRRRKPEKHLKHLVSHREGIVWGLGKGKESEKAAAKD